MNNETEVTKLGEALVYLSMAHSALEQISREASEYFYAPSLSKHSSMAMLRKVIDLANIELGRDIPDAAKKYADHAAEIERLSKLVKYWTDCFETAIKEKLLERDGRLAAESKLSQLQLSNEEKAKKIARTLRDAPIDLDAESAESDVAATILAILNGGQQ